MNEKYYLLSDIKEIVNNLKKYHKKFFGKKFLITGANGLIGGFIADLGDRIIDGSVKSQFRDLRRTLVGTQ